jgi:hypothetical protein
LFEIGVASEVHGGHAVLDQQGKQPRAQQGGLAHARLSAQGGDPRGVLGDEFVEGLRLFLAAKEEAGAALIVRNEAAEWAQDGMTGRRHW